MKIEYKIFKIIMIEKLFIKLIKKNIFLLNFYYFVNSKYFILLFSVVLL